MDDDSVKTRLTVVGLGGIGSNLVELLVPALEKIGVAIEISLMDGDIVEEHNLGHQRYTSKDIGEKKVMCLTRRFENLSNVKLIPITENLRAVSQLVDSEMVIVCVDRPEPRRLVHGSVQVWLDLRCSGDGYVALSSDSDCELVEMMTPDHEPKSCQISGALEIGNIEFGFAVASAIGAQWAVQKIRKLITPTEMLGSITYGQLKFPDTSDKMELKQ